MTLDDLLGFLHAINPFEEINEYKEEKTRDMWRPIVTPYPYKNFFSCKPDNKRIDYSEESNNNVEDKYYHYRKYRDINNSINTLIKEQWDDIEEKITTTDNKRKELLQKRLEERWYKIGSLRETATYHSCIMAINNTKEKTKETIKSNNIFKIR
jgi:hypothetical protein